MTDMTGRFAARHGGGRADARRVTLSALFCGTMLATGALTASAGLAQAQENDGCVLSGDGLTATCAPTGDTTFISYPRVSLDEPTTLVVTNGFTAAPDNNAVTLNSTSDATIRIETLDNGARGTITASGRAGGASSGPITGIVGFSSGATSVRSDANVVVRGATSGYSTVNGIVATGESLAEIVSSGDVTLDHPGSGFGNALGLRADADGATGRAVVVNQGRVSASAKYGSSGQAAAFGVYATASDVLVQNEGSIVASGRISLSTSSAARATGIEARGTLVDVRNIGAVTATGGSNVGGSGTRGGSATGVYASASEIVRVTSAGPVTATGGESFYTGNAYGIRTSGNDGAFVTNDGDVTVSGGREATGIQARAQGEIIEVVNRGSVDVSGVFQSKSPFGGKGTIAGIDARNVLGGDIVVRNEGSVTVDEAGNGPAFFRRLNGLRAVVLNSAGDGGSDVTVTTTGDVAVTSELPGLEDASNPKYASAAVFAASFSADRVAGGSGGVAVSVDGAAVSASGGTIQGVFATGATSTVTLTGGASVSASGPGANGVVVASEIVFTRGFVDDFTFASSTNRVAVGQGSSVVAENGVGILDLDEFTGSGAEEGAFAPNTTTVEVAGSVRGGPVDGSGTAISLGAGDDTLVVQPGFEITGLADGGTNRESDGETPVENDLLALGGTGTGTFDFSLVETEDGPTTGLQYVNFERFQKRDASSFTVTGTNSGTFALPVLGGTLLVDGTLANASLPVSSGATLGGTGTVGSLTAQSGSTIAPGNAAQPFGTLTTTGDALFEAGSTFAVRLDDTGRNSRLDVGGQTTIEGGTIAVAADPGAFSTQRTYTVIASPNGVAGRFGGVVDNLPDIDFTDIYNADSVQLGFTVQQPPVTPPGTPPVTPPGQPPVAPFSDKTNALASVFGAGATAMNFAETISQRSRLGNPTDAPVAPAGAAPSLLGYAAPAPLTQLPVMEAVYGADLAVGGLEPMPITPVIPEPETSYGAWAAGFGERTDVSTTGAFAGYRGDSAGGAAGLEARLGGAAYDLVVGFAGGYSESDVRTAGGRGDITGGHVGVYALYADGPLSLSGAVSYSRFDYDLSRSIAFGGGAVTADGSADGDAFAGFAEAAYDLGELAGLGGVKIAPLARVRGVTLDRDGYTETGAGILNLTVDRDTLSQVYGGAGVRLGTEAQVGSLLVSPTVDLLYERNVSSTTKISNSSIAGVPGATFATGVYNGDRDLFAIGAGLGLGFTPNLVGTVRYDGSFGSDVESHRGSVGLAYRF